jgi:hypothetical protein
MNQELNSPLNRVLDTLAFWLSRDPYLQVLDAVVILHSILVMHVLIGAKRAAKVLFHAVSVLGLGFAVSRPDNVTIIVVEPAFSGLPGSYRSASAVALLRAALHPSMRLRKKWGAANFARFGNQGIFGFPLIPALLRAVVHAIFVCVFALERFSAVQTFLGYWWGTDYPGSPAVNSGRHVSSSFCYKNCDYTKADPASFAQKLNGVTQA